MTKKQNISNAVSSRFTQVRSGSFTYQELDEALPHHSNGAINAAIAGKNEIKLDLFVDLSQALGLDPIIELERIISRIDGREIREIKELGIPKVSTDNKIVHNIHNNKVVNINH